MLQHLQTLRVSPSLLSLSKQLLLLESTPNLSNTEFNSLYKSLLTRASLKTLHFNQLIKTSPESIQQLLSDMKDLGIKQDGVTISLRIEHEKSIEARYKLFQESKSFKLSPRTYTILINQAIMDENAGLSRIWEIFASLKKNGVVPELATFALMLDAFAEANDEKAVAKVYNNLLVIASSNPDTHDQKFWNSSLWSAVINAQRVLKKDDKVLNRLLYFAKKGDFSVEADCLVSIMQYWIEKGKFGAALRVFQKFYGNSDKETRKLALIACQGGVSSEIVKTTVIDPFWIKGVDISEWTDAVNTFIKLASENGLESCGLDARDLIYLALHMSKSQVVEPRHPIRPAVDSFDSSRLMGKELARICGSVQDFEAFQVLLGACGDQEEMLVAEFAGVCLEHGLDEKNLMDKLSQVRAETAYGQNTAVSCGN